MIEAENYCRERGSRFMDIYIVNLREELPRVLSNVAAMLRTGRLRFPQMSKRRYPVISSTWRNRL